MKTLYLLRHAKSSRDNPRLEDIERPLNGRGRRNAAEMGAWLARRGIRPALVLCSPALRTRETLERLTPALDGLPVRLEDGIYEASARALLDLVAGLDQALPSAMIIGHNPGLERLAQQLAAGESLLVERLREKYPTCALAVLECAGDSWADFGPQSCRLVTFLRPADLEIT